MSGLFAVINPGRAFVAAKLFRTCRVFDNRTFRGQISFKNGYRTIFLNLLNRENHIFPFQTVIVKISHISFEEPVLLNHFQVLSQGLSGNGHHIQIQMIP